MENILITSLIILFIHVLLNWEGHILSGLGRWIFSLPDIISKPLGCCMICMTSIYDIPIMIYLNGFNIESLFYLFAVGGLNAIIAEVLDLILTIKQGLEK